MQQFTGIFMTSFKMSFRMSHTLSHHVSQNSMSHNISNESQNSIRMSHTFRKIDFFFLSNRMGYDRGDSFPLAFEPNGFSFDTKSNGKLSPRSYSIQFQRKKNIFF